MSTAKHPIYTAGLVGIPILVVLLLVLLWPDTSKDESSPNAGEEIAETLAVSQSAESAEVSIEQIEQGRIFIQEVLPVLSQWNTAELTPYLSAATLAGTDGVAMAEVLSVLSTSLGNLLRFAEPEFVGIVSEDRNTAQHLKLAFQFTGVYQLGEAEIYLVLQETQGEYFLYTFNIRTM